MPKKIDLTGEKFGELTVIEEGPHKNGRVAWYCNCSCGKTHILYTSNTLRRGRATSCGCKKSETCSKNGKKRKNDLTGQVFGYLTVLKDSNERTSKGEVIWECQCECGVIKNIPGYILTRGDAKSCGCKKNLLCAEINTKDLIGQRFGKLTVLEKIFNTDPSLNNHTFWKCKCDCGNIKIVNSRSLLNGGTQSCGCLLSKGESKIQQILEEAQIKFETQKTFDNCRFKDSNRLAKFDFYLPDYNLLIEYDGEQHFHINEFFGGLNNFENTQQRDNFKNLWCKENNIPLIRIPYTDYDLINLKYLEDKFNEYIGFRS